MTKENLKLIWDFRGPDAERTAEHHLIHLKEYIIENKVPAIATGVEQVGKNAWTAFMAVPKENMIEIRDALKPNRGKVFENEEQS